MVERIVNDIDEIVRHVRFEGWQTTHAGEREVKKALRKTLFKYRLHQDQELFDPGRVDHQAFNSGLERLTLQVYYSGKASIADAKQYDARKLPNCALGASRPAAYQCATKTLPTGAGRSDSHLVPPIKTRTDGRSYKRPRTAPEQSTHAVKVGNNILIY